MRHDAQRAEDAAAQLDDAARASMEHAQNVEAALAKIRSIERWFGQRVTEARNELANAVGVITHAASDILDHAPRAPAPGSPAWLEFARRWRP